MVLPAADGQTVPSLNDNSTVGPPPLSAEDGMGGRPDHLWSVGYVKLIWNDTNAIFTAPLHWDGTDWLDAGGAVGVIGTTAAFDDRIEDFAQSHRSQGEDRFMKQWQNLGEYWGFGVLGAFEVWGELVGDSTAKAVVMDGLAASAIGPGILGTAMKEAVGRVRPPGESTYDFKPFSGNASFPSGHSFEAFTIATAIAEHYPQWWVQALCYGSAGLVGYARLEQNAHYASDVVAGGILGWAITRGVVRRNNRPNPHRLTWIPYANGSGYGIMAYESF